MTCPNRVDIPWGRDDEAALCALDDGPCDVTRKGICDRWGKEGVLGERPLQGLHVPGRRAQSMRHLLQTVSGPLQTDAAAEED
jgi:hypothetical protein